MHPSYALQRKALMEELDRLNAEGRLYAARLRAEGHKQQTIAELLGIDQGTVSKWLREAAGLKKYS